MFSYFTKSNPIRVSNDIFVERNSRKGRNSLKEFANIRKFKNLLYFERIAWIWWKFSFLFSQRKGEHKRKFSLKDFTKYRERAWTKIWKPNVLKIFVKYRKSTIKSQDYYDRKGQTWWPLGIYLSGKNGEVI